MILVSIYDRKAELYTNILAQRSVVDAIRGMTQFLKSAGASDSPLLSFPTDFQLVHVADFDDKTGAIRPVMTQLGLISDFLPAGGSK